MTSGKKFLYAVLAFLPFISLVVYISLLLSMMAGLMQDSFHRHEPDPATVINNIIPVLIAAFITGISALTALIIYIINAVNNKAIDSTERIIWIIAFVFAGILSIPIYFFMRITRIPIEN